MTPCLAVDGPQKWPPGKQFGGAQRTQWCYCVAAEYPGATHPSGWIWGMVLHGGEVDICPRQWPCWQLHCPFLSWCGQLWTAPHLMAYVGNPHLRGLTPNCSQLYGPAGKHCICSVTLTTGSCSLRKETDEFLLIYTLYIRVVIIQVSQSNGSRQYWTLDNAKYSLERSCWHMRFSSDFIAVLEFLDGNHRLVVVDVEVVMIFHLLPFPLHVVAFSLLCHFGSLHCGPTCKRSTSTPNPMPLPPPLPPPHINLPNRLNCAFAQSCTLGKAQQFSGQSPPKKIRQTKPSLRSTVISFAYESPASNQYIYTLYQANSVRTSSHTSCVTNTKN